SNPDQQKLILLSQTLGVSEPWLMGYDVPMIEPSESENNSETIEETVFLMKKLEEPRQQVVLDTANIQLKEQEEQKSKIVSIKNEQEKFDLADLVDDNKVDWDKWVSFDGRPLTDEVKEAMKKALGKELEDK
ncbi:phage repressor protein, partial [Lactococcus lactis]